MAKSVLLLLPLFLISACGGISVQQPISVVGAPPSEKKMVTVEAELPSKPEPVVVASKPPIPAAVMQKQIPSKSFPKFDAGKFESYHKFGKVIQHSDAFVKSKNDECSENTKTSKGYVVVQERALVFSKADYSVVQTVPFDDLVLTVIDKGGFYKHLSMNGAQARSQKGTDKEVRFVKSDKCAIAYVKLNGSFLYAMSVSDANKVMMELIGRLRIPTRLTGELRPYFYSQR